MVQKAVGSSPIARPIFASTLVRLADVRYTVCMRQPKVLSCFSGAFGLDLGLERAGFEVIWANEIEEDFVNTIRLNRPATTIVQADMKTLDPAVVMKRLRLRPGQLDVMAGGPPCQSFSTAGRRLSINDARGNLMLQYIHWVNVFRPQYFILENVRGLLSAPIKHVPHVQRGKKWQPAPDETSGSALRLVLAEIAKIGYTVNYQLINAANYGVPQTRERVVLLGSRDGTVLEFPEPTHAKVPTGGLLPWATLGDALMDLHEPEPEHATYSAARLQFLKQVPSGGNWRSLPTALQAEAMGGAFTSGGGKVGFYRRLSWSKPSPTVTTAPHQKATDMCHPEADRPLSVREYARIQQFPDDWQFYGSTSQKYKQIGNAVPVGLGYSIGTTIYQALAGPDVMPAATTVLQTSSLLAA